MLTVWSTLRAAVVVMPYVRQTGWFGVVAIAVIALVLVAREWRHRRRQAHLTRLSSHDLRTPLASIISLARIVREDPALPFELEGSLKLIEQAGYRALNIANLTHDLFKMEQKTYPLNVTNVSIRVVISRVLAELQAHVRTRELTVAVPCEGFSGQPVVFGDELLSHSMLSNLVKNAIEASPFGGTVTIRVLNGNPVRISIHNAGAVSQGLRTQFFKKHATVTKTGGTGLGAYAARLMAETQGGSVWLETDEQTGTTVTIELPPAAGTREAPAGEAKLPMMDASEFPTRARSILLVDDDPIVRVITRRFLSHPLWTVDEAENGPLALRKFAEGAFDTVFVDIEMPVMNGIEVVRRIRALEAERGGGGRRAAVLVFSSHEHPEYKQRAHDAGCDGYVVKPATYQKILEAVDGIHSADTEPLDPDIRELMPSFLEAKERELHELDEALASGAADPARAVSHRMRGSFSLYGFGDAAAVCAEIEAFAAANSLASARERLPILYEQFRLLQARFADSSQAN